MNKHNINNFSYQVVLALQNANLLKTKSKEKAIEAILPEIKNIVVETVLNITVRPFKIDNEDEIASEIFKALNKYE